MTERSRDLERVLTFVDAIAAVAITLLVLPLVDLAGEVTSEDQSVSQLIRDHSNLFWSFGLSFAVIARLWLAQHALMRSVVRSNQAVVTWLILWSLALVFLPFPTALLSGGGNQAITKVLYIGTLAANSICLTVLAAVIRRNPSLHEPDQAPSPYAGLVNTLLFALALVLALAVPAVGYYPLILLVTADWLTAGLARVMGRAKH